MNGVLETLGVKTFAGLVGGIVALRFFEGLNVLGRIWTIVGGMAMSFYFAHPIIDFFGLKQSYEGAVGFIVGLFGMSIAAALFTALKEIQLAEVLRGWISRR